MEITQTNGDTIRIVTVNGDEPRTLTQAQNAGVHITAVDGDTPLPMSESNPVIYRGGGGGTTDYTELTNKPTIGGVTVQGNKTLTDYGLPSIPSKVSDLTNDAGYITGYTETDPTVPDWAKQSSKPSYTAEEVGALPDDTVIPTVPSAVSAFTNDAGYITSSAVPTKVSQLDNDSGFISSFTETDPTVPAWAKEETKPTYTASEVGAFPDDTKYAASPSVGGPASVANGIHFAKVDDTSTSTVFTATIPGVTAYYDGLTIVLYNGKVTSASGFTVNINNLGALACYSNMSMGNPVTPTTPTRDTTIFNINYAMVFIYYSNIGGTNTEGWIIYRGYDANTNTIGYQVRTNSMSLPMTSKTYRYRLFFESADHEHFVPANNSTATNATTARTPVTEKINPFGDIRYYGTTTVLSAGDRPAVGNLWQQYTLTIGYSFQKSPNYSLTSWKPVYLVCAPQSDGSAIIDSTDPITQTLPSSEDGKIYIYLGVAYSATAIELTINHPVYY